MTYALLFPGQGGQHAGMLPWLESQPAGSPTLAAMAQTLGAHWRERLADPHWGQRNAIAQVLLTGTALAAWATLAPLLPGPPAIVAGYSVGELAALACAGAFSAETALRLAAARAQAMDDAAVGQHTGLLSVAGAVDIPPGLELAIRIAPDHVILAGTDAALNDAESRFSAHGAHAKRLPVALASHSSWMHAAAAAFAHQLSDTHFDPVRCPVALNATGAAARRTEVLRAALSRQIDTPVQWSSCMDSVAEFGPACVLELGPGDALSRLWAARHPHIPVRAADDFRDAASIAAWIARQTSAP